MIFGYVRVSTDDQNREGRTSLEDQERRIRGTAMVLGSDEPTTIKDIGVSGSVALCDRPAGGVMFSALQPGDFLIGAKLDRLFRSASDALATVEALHKRGVKVILTDMGSDPVTDGGAAKLFFTMLAAVAEFERWRTRERTADGRRGKAARGGHIGGDAPYGWTKVGAGRAATLVRNEIEQGVIAQIVGIYARTGSYNQTSIAMNADRVAAREGQWTRQTIKRIVARNVIPIRSPHNGVSRRVQRDV